MTSGAEGFKPYVPAEEQPPELTLRAILIGAICGILFGASSTYLALRVGLTVSASIPIAVIAIALMRPSNGRRAILEHNITQTLGSAGESIAGAVVFTVPALIFLGYPLRIDLTTLMALTGGMLGVLMMVPLRRYLIVKEHGQLRYPEGKACAEILISGEQRGTSAAKVFLGMAIGAVAKAYQAILWGARSTVSFPVSVLKGSSIDCDFEPPLLGVGYIIGYRTSVMMVAGSLLSSFVLTPMIIFFGRHSNEVIAPSVDLIKDMSPSDVWNRYVRYIGAGSVATGGIFGLLRALPSIVSSIGASARSLTGGSGGQAQLSRTDRDTPTPVLVAGAIAIVLFIWLVPFFHMNLLGAILILVLGFLFSVVSSRITGEVGSSSCPLSGMTIGVLMGTCGAFLITGWEGAAYSRLALMVGAIVCVAISNAGTCSQDLKTGFLVGSTPVRQQGALLIGVLTSVLAVGWTMYFLNASETKEVAIEQPFTVQDGVLQRGDTIKSISDGKEYRFVRLEQDEVPKGREGANYLVDPATREVRYQRIDGIGQERYNAPQSRLMSVVIDGLLTRRLPWDLILLGAAIAIFIEILGFRSLTFAVGVYLPLSSTMPVFLGGLARLFADRVYKRVPDAEDEPEGTLFSSGIIAGASLVGIASAAVTLLPGYNQKDGYHPSLAMLRNLVHSLAQPGQAGFELSQALTVALVLVLAYLIFHYARPRKDDPNRPRTHD
ncbi:MAG: oligopeptide transporter, OPT family [Planctomycetota bacterium]